MLAVSPQFRYTDIIGTATCVMFGTGLLDGVS